MGTGARGSTIMELTKIEEFAKIRPADPTVADLHVARCLAAAAAGDTDACYDLGVAFSTGSHGVAVRPDRGAQVVQPRRRRGPRGSRLVPRRHLRGDDRARDRRSPAPRPRMARAPARAAPPEPSLSGTASARRAAAGPAPRPRARARGNRRPPRGSPDRRSSAPTRSAPARSRAPACGRPARPPRPAPARARSPRRSPGNSTARNAGSGLSTRQPQ